MASVLFHLEQWYEQSLKDDFELVRQRWCEQSCTLGKHVRIVQDHQEWSGIAEKLLTNGGLLLRTNDGSTQNVVCGDIVAFE